MATVPATARVVVIGAGIVGNSLVHHLARLGWRDIVQIDKGALPNPGGSTGHASNFIFPVDHSREMTDLTLDSMRQYKELGVFTESGGFEVARTEERMEELRRRMSSAQGVGHRGASWSRPDHVVEKVPFLEKDKILGAFWTPSVGVVDSLRAGTLMRESALALGALTVVPTVEVIGLDVEEGRIRRVRTTGGDIEAETVVIACGVWSPKLAKMAGARDPADPRRAPDDLGGPDPAAGRAAGRDLVPDRPGHGHLLLRAPARRRHGGRLLRPPRDPARPRGHPLDRAGASCPPPRCRSRPTTSTRSWSRPSSSCPTRWAPTGAEIRYAINGLLSLTPDGLPILGETPEVKGLWSAAAVWIKEGPGIGRAVAEWMTHGHSEIDVAPLRHRPLLPAPAHPRARALAHVRGVQQDLRHRAPRRAVGRRARQAARPDARRREGGGRGVLRDRRLGAADLVRVATRPCSASTATR